MQKGAGVLWYRGERGEIFLFLYLIICLREFKKAFIADIWITKLNLAEYVSLSLNSRSELTIHVNSWKFNVFNFCTYNLGEYIHV